MIRDRRRERRGEGGAAHYRMRQKLVSIGDDYWIENDQGERVYKVDGKALRLRKTLIFQNTDGRALVKIQERMLHVRDTMEIEDPDGNRVATVKKAVTSRGCSISITRASPIVAVSGISSSPAASWMKCTGPSMWVPLCTPMARWETLHSSPRPTSITRCSTIGGLSGQCGMPCRNVTDTSIQPVISASVTTASATLVRPAAGQDPSAGPGRRAPGCLPGC